MSLFGHWDCTKQGHRWGKWRGGVYTQWRHCKKCHWRQVEWIA